MHESFFSYSITRPYPYRWFTWVVVFGGILTTVLFSIVNLATNGYVLRTVFTTNPNRTLSEIYWFQRAPWSWMGKIEASCQSQNLAIGTKFFTTNMGLSYELTSLSVKDTSTYIPAVSYLNNTLRDCMVETIEITAARSSSANNVSVPWVWGNTWARAAAACTFDHVTPSVRAVFNVMYSNPSNPIVQFPSLNNQTDSAQWWGSLALSNGMSSVRSRLGLRSTEREKYESGNFLLVRTPNGTSDIMSDNFFSINGSLTGDNGMLYYAFSNDDWKSKPVGSVLGGDLVIPVDGFSKSFYASIMHDLGPQNDQPSPLINGTVIEYLLGRANRTDYLRHIYDDGTWRLDDAGTDIADYYAVANNTVGPLQNHTAQLYTQYTCSIPEKKKTGSLVVSVIIANFVFLSAAWKILNWTATGLLAVEDKKMNFCTGCKQDIKQLYNEGLSPESSLLRPLSNVDL